MSKENEEGRDGSMDLWPEWCDGERWASAPRTRILPLSKSGMSESGTEKMGFSRRRMLEAQRAGLREEREWRRLKSSIWQGK